MTIEPDRKTEAIQRAQVGSLMGANGSNEPQNKSPKKQSPASGARPKKYALEMWVEIETSAGVHSAPEEDSYSANFAIDCINHAYPRCTGMYLGVVGHMLAFYGKKTNPRAGFLLDQAIAASKVIAVIPTWMGYYAMWRVKCISTSEASEILAGCKRIEKESLRWAHWELQQQFSALQVGSSLSATGQPFQPWVALQSSQEDDAPRSSPVWRGLVGSSPAPGFALDSPMRRAFPSHHQSSDDDRVSTETSSISDKRPRQRRGSRRSRSSWSGSDSDGTRSSRGRQKKKDGFSSKIQIPEFGGKKGHTHDVAGTFWQWAHSYIMPLVVSSLMGDASDVFDLIRGLNSGRTQDLTTLLQMLREHYCGSLTFREQRNTIENLCQKPQEAAIDFLIRVGTSMSNLGNDWKDKLADGKLQSLQYEVFLNRVHEEIRHIPDSEIAKNRGNLTPQQMYEAVKRYKTYVAHNKRLEGKGASPSTSQPKAAGHTSSYKPRFHKTTAFTATIPEVEDDGLSCTEPSPQEGTDAYGNESSQEDDEGLYIPSYLEEVIPDDPVLQVKMARAIRAQEVETQRCFTCGQPGHLQRDHWKYEEKNGNGPLQPKGPPQNKSALERVKAKTPPVGRGVPPTNPPRWKGPHTWPQMLSTGSKALRIWERHLLMMSWLLASWTMERSSTSSCPPMPRSGEWTSCPWTSGWRDWWSHPTHQRHRWHLSGARWVRYDERQGARCHRVWWRPDRHSDGWSGYDRVAGYPRHSHYLSGHGGNQGKWDLQVGSAMGLLASLLVDERCTGQARPGGGEWHSQQTNCAPPCRWGGKSGE